MFFDDTGRVMSEVLRVPKPGGRAAFLVWGSSVVLRLVRDAEMPTEARKMFRFAAPGSLEGVLRAAGFCNTPIS